MTLCPQCNRRHPDSVTTCDCGYDLEAHRHKLRKKQLARSIAAQPHRRLSLFRELLRMMGAICIIGGLVGATLLFFQEESLWRSGLVLAAGLIGAIPYFAFAEVITLLLAISTQQVELQERLQRIEREPIPEDRMKAFQP